MMRTSGSGSLPRGLSLVALALLVQCRGFEDPQRIDAELAPALAGPKDGLLPAKLPPPTPPQPGVATQPAVQAPVEPPKPEPPLPAPPKREPERHRDELASTATETWVYAEPRWSARRLGYLRAGSVVERRKKPAGFDSCTEGWYRVEPRGYVCVGKAATIDPSEAAVALSRKRPEMTTLPYLYAVSRFPTPPLYARLPNEEQTQRVEPDIGPHLRMAARDGVDSTYVAPPAADPVPQALLGGHVVPALGRTQHAADALLLGRAKPRSGFALLATFDHDDRRFGLTTDLALLPLDRTRVVRPSSFAGIALDGDTKLPVAFVRSRNAVRFTLGDKNQLERGDALAFREAVPVTGNERRFDGVAYLEAKDGSWIRSDQATTVVAHKGGHAWANGTRKWIDVSLRKQSLVAYEGKKPVYVTLVSTGVDGFGDPKKTRSTIQGTFLVHTKHVTVTMDDDKVGDEFDFRDVPFVQYFTDGFAFHAAYWHDDFGVPRSHGCVNLSPKDAAWLFSFTGPELPEGWHGAVAKKGTLVHIRI